MNKESIQKIQDLIEDEVQAILFAEWLKQEAEKLNVTEDYYLMEFI